MRRARPAADDRAQRDAVRDRLHGLDRGREGIATGISAHDRSRTVQVAIDRSKGADDLVRPGHIFPLRARDGGVLQRGGQTEASSTSLASPADPGGVVCRS